MNLFVRRLSFLFFCIGLTFFFLPSPVAAQLSGGFTPVPNQCTDTDPANSPTVAGQITYLQSGNWVTRADSCTDGTNTKSLEVYEYRCITGGWGVQWIACPAGTSCSGGRCVGVAGPTPTRTRTPTPAPPTATRTRTPTPAPPTATRTRTPTPAPPTATRTRTPTPVTNLACNAICSGNSQCSSNYCFAGACRNLSCSSETDCVCAAPTNTPTRTPTPLPPTATRTRTPTPLPPTATRTATPIPPTATRTPTPIPPTATRTTTPIPPSPTPPGGLSPTPTIIGGITATPTPVGGLLSCNAVCGGNSQCASGFCFAGVCREPLCSGDAACSCAVGTPTPTIIGGLTATPTIIGGITATPTIIGGITATPTIIGGLTATPTPTIIGGITATPTTTPITEEETVTGSGTNTNTLVLNPVGGSSGGGTETNAYVVTIAVGDNGNVTSVSGLGLTWTEQVHQGSGQGTQGMEIWTAVGTVSSAGPVTITTSASLPVIVATVSRFSGVQSTSPFENVTSANTNGQDTTDITGGVDSTSTSIDVGTATPNTMILVSTDSRTQTISTGPSGFTQQGSVTGGTGGNATTLTVHTRLLSSSGNYPGDATLTGPVDWIVGALALRPAASAPAPTPAPWIQVVGGDVYQPVVSQSIPAGQQFLIADPDMTHSDGIIWTNDGRGTYGNGAASQTNRLVGASLSNPTAYSFYDTLLKERGTLVTSATVGEAGTLAGGQAVYRYQGSPTYTLDATFTPQTTTTIFLVDGTLTIPATFPVSATQVVVFIVKGGITIDSSITSLSGVYISENAFTVAAGPDPLVIEGMVYAKSLSLNRTFRSDITPTYQLVYQPKYIVQLLPYLGRQNVSWDGK